MPRLLERIVDFLEKFDLPESHKLQQEIQQTRTFAPHLEPILALKMLVLKNAQKNTAEAVKAMEHLGLVEEAMEFAAVINKELVETSAEVNKA
jgi:hypothetical protein